MYKIRDLVQLSTEFLEKKNIAFSRLCSEELLAFILKRKRIGLFLNCEALVKKREADLYFGLVKRKAEGEPLGYLLEEGEFLECKLTLTPDVLIPRQETEILVDLALKKIPNEPQILWDLCTGSGCMGLAAKKHRSQLQVTLSDLSAKALACAKKNAEQNQLEVSCLQSDLLGAFEGKKADFVFCNPPYVSEEEYSKLEREVHFEPREAHLAKEGGLEFYKRLAADLPACLNPGAKVFLEIGHNQGRAVRKIFSQSHWKQRRYEKDWAGKDRFFFLEFRFELP